MFQLFFHDCTLVVEVGADVTEGGGGGRPYVLYIKKSYSSREPRRVFHPSRELSGVFGWRNTRFWLSDEIFVLDFDWLPTVLGIRQCIKIVNGNRQSISIGYSILIMYKGRDWVNFGTVGQFSALWDFSENFFSGPPAPAVAYNFYACGYFKRLRIIYYACGDSFDLMLLKKIV